MSRGWTVALVLFCLYGGIAGYGADHTLLGFLAGVAEFGLYSVIIYLLFEVYDK